jgi:hypothetical protein
VSGFEQLVFVAAVVTVAFLVYFFAGSRATPKERSRARLVGRSIQGCLLAVVVFVGVLSLLIIILYALFSGSE